MTQNDSFRLRPLLDRLSRLAAADAWLGELTPTQMAALEYLGRANRFSRAPSQVADYLGATRGTVSQTLKTLERKGLVREQKSTEDKRRISYDITASGRAAIAGSSQIDAALQRLTPAERDPLEAGLRAVLGQMIAQRGGRPFGLCRTCRYHAAGSTGRLHCRLLDVALTVGEADQICHEHALTG